MNGGRWRSHLRALAGSARNSTEALAAPRRVAALRTAVASLAVICAFGAAGTLSGAPPNDDFGAATRISGPAGVLSGTNAGATREPGEPAHALTGGGRSVWWRWVSPVTGGAHFETLGSDFDTVIAVYQGSSLGRLDVVASNDDRIGSLQGAVAFEVESGREYRVAVDGFSGEEGRIRLAWRSVSGGCSGSITAPSGPLPLDGQRDVEGEVTLRWNVAEEALVRKVIYGEDNRHEVFQEPDQRLREAARSVVALTGRSHVLPAPGGYRISGPTAGSDHDLCSTERFFNQPSIPFCSGVLVAPDLVVTAGHCILTEDECSDTAIIFGYQMVDAGTARLEFPESEVRFCREVLSSENSQEGDDWALIRLDRPVDTRAPLRIRRTGRVAEGEGLVAIGHPLGLPLKIADGARVRDGAPETYFVTNTDTYIGNSGSPLLNTRTLDVEGILVRGEEDFVESGNCFRSQRCGENDCQGEDATRTTEFDALVPFGDATRYEVFFGPCGSLARVGETGESFWSLGPLETGTEYCWKVVAKNECSELAGPVWSFSTRPSEEFLRGDAVEDGRVNITDAIGILTQLFRGGDPPACRKAADVDDSGSVNLTDAIYLLIFRFRGGAPPPSPFASCGLDPTADALECTPPEECVSLEG